MYRDLNPNALCFPSYSNAIEFASGCEDERDAARVLGYKAESWNSTRFQQPASSAKTWSEMTDEEKSALLVLGYSAHGWDTREPHSSYKLWSELTDEERIAADVLGYKAAKWNNRAGQAKPPDHVWKAWTELTNDERAALEMLGYNQQLWDDENTPRPESYFKSWDELTVCGEDPFVARCSSILPRNVFAWLD